VTGILDRFSLEGKVAIVTGASSGLGVAFATGLAQAGADIAICARRADRLEQTREQVVSSGRRCVAVTADVARPDDCRTVVQTAVSELGRVDILINNAGIGTAVPALREAPEQFAQVIDVNLNGSYFMAQAAAAAMRETGGGSVVNIGSILGLISAGLPQAAYSASKAAIIGLTRDLAQQWTGRYNIRVNALAPGFFRSEMTDQYPDDYIPGRLQRVPAGRIGESEELVAAAIFLASDASSYVTGVTIPVDGGTITG
jgi:NAD(P)-dependent dehydrogenase (short-subunit alcohol dehydrogenase family)